MPIERWRPVKDFEGFYEVSDLGRVRRVVPNKPPRILKQHVGERGRRSVCLSKGAVVVRRKVHTMVLEAFVGPRPDGCEGCHFNGNAAENNVANLRWDTRVGNMADAKRHGTLARGERHGRSKLWEQDVRAIRERAASGEKARVIASAFGVSESAVSLIKLGRKWAHVV